MKVTLTGATGFVGSHIRNELESRGHDVTALVRDEEQGKPYIQISGIWAYGDNSSIKLSPSAIT
jgi:nucleoside-diphosphate-sugar epimerase